MGEHSLPDRWALNREVSRRGFLGAGAAAGAALALGRMMPAAIRSSPDWVDASLFTLGVASGDPRPDGFVLWTRLAPDPLGGGGMPSQRVDVQWQVATDELFRHVVGHGVVTARPEAAHAVHVRVRGLAAGRWYWYRFRVGLEVSPVGRTRTAPNPWDLPERLRFGFASCQHYETGYFTAHRGISEEDLDAVVYLGDYIYEGGASSGGVRSHVTPEIRTLDEYRSRYALYKLDPDLQLAHARFPWVLTWDDHEVENNYADLMPDLSEEAPDFAARRANAYRAYWEHQPLPVPRPDRESMRLYRRWGFGRLATFHVLDGRQYRSDQACGAADDLGPRCDDASDASRTMLGADQEAWLARGLTRSDSRWNVLANQVILSALHLPAGLYNLDQWDGYPAARRRLMRVLRMSGARNPVVVTGDIHIAGAADVKADFSDQGSDVIAAEYVGTSISSSFPPEFVPLIRNAVESDPRNAHIKYFDDLSRHGYVRCVVTRKALRADYRYVSSVSEPTATVHTGASFVTEAGNPGVQPA